MTIATDQNLSIAHITAFGAIINLSAKMETLMVIAIAGIADMDFGNCMILTSPLAYQGKRDVLRNLNNTKKMPNEYNADIKGIIDEFDGLQKIRNWIAHSTWINGERPASIKPLQLKIRSGKPVTLGVDESEQDYLVEELWREAAALNALCDRFGVLLKQSALTKYMDEKIAETISASAASVGNPPSTSC